MYENTWKKRKSKSLRKKKEKDYIKKSQKEFLELKYTITQTKTSNNGLSSTRKKKKEERISELEDKTIEIT